ncbi:MAG: hypothetical protein QXL66_00605 [Thermoplasmata archaeon]
MKITSILIISILIMPGILSINENSSYINVNEYGYSILFGKNYPLIMVNSSNVSITFVVSRIILKNMCDELNNLTWQKKFSSDDKINYTISTETSHSAYRFTMLLEKLNNSLNILIIFHASKIKSKSIAIIGHIFNKTFQINEISMIDKNMNYEFNGPPQNEIKINNAKFEFSNGTVYRSNNQNIIIFSDVINGNATVYSKITLPITSEVTKFILSPYPFLGILFGIGIIVSGAILLKRKS